MKTDIEIARSIELVKIKELAEKFVASFVSDYNARQSAAQIPDNFKKNA